MSLRDDASAFEASLGGSGDAALGTTETLVRDEREEFPIAGWNRLHALGFPGELVPATLEGKLHDAERLLVLGRCVARRDLTLAIATGQGLLGALPIWIAGSPEQRSFVRRALLSGESGALALTERAHGSDLASTSTTLVAVGETLALSGEKWAINNGTRGRYLSVLARSDEAGGPRGFSIVLVDVAETGDTSSPLPKLGTHGIRGADISGRRFDAASLREAAIVGKRGHGLDLVQRTMQVSRTLCSAFSLGGAETALRLAVDFASSRMLYGDSVLAIPSARATLRDAYVAYVVADLVAHATARALSIAPEQASISSAVAKVFVPEEGIAIVDRASAVLGARHYLREGLSALAQKIVRDVRLIPLFDGSAAVNRSALAAEWPRVAAATLDAREASEAIDRTLAMVDVGAAISAVAFERLRATSRGLADPFQALVALATRAGERSYELARLAERACRVDTRLRALAADPEQRMRSNHAARAHELADAFASAYVVGLLFARAIVTTDAIERVILERGLDRMLARVEGRGPLDASLDDVRRAAADEALDDELVRRWSTSTALGCLAESLAKDGALLCES